MTLLVNEETDETATKKASQDGDRKGSGGKTQTNASHEDNSFEAFTENRDEWQHKHGVFLAPALEATTCSAASGAILGFECFCQLHTPFILKFRNAEESRSHGGDDY